MYLFIQKYPMYCFLVQFPASRHSIAATPSDSFCDHIFPAGHYLPAGISDPGFSLARGARVSCGTDGNVFGNLDLGSA